MSKRFPIALLVILAIGFLAGGYYYYAAQNRSLERSQSTFETDSRSIMKSEGAAGWDIYRNTSHRFQFEYPTEYILAEPQKDNIPAPNPAACGSESVVCLIYQGSQNGNPNFGGASFDLWTPSGGWDTENKCASFVSNHRQEIINGQTFYWRKGRPMQQGGLFDAEDEYFFTTFHNQTCYAVLFGVVTIGQGELPEKENIISSFKKILSTLKFTD